MLSPLRYSCSPLKLPNKTLNLIRILFSALQQDTPATFQNDVTHWWDGSQLYGSDEQTSAKLRSFKDGKMKVSRKDGLLPVDSKTGIEQTGNRLSLYPVRTYPKGLIYLIKMNVSSDLNSYFLDLMTHLLWLM